MTGGQDVPPAGASERDKPKAEPLLIAPRRPITRYRPVVIAAGIGGVVLLVGAGFIIGLGGKRPSRDAGAAEPVQTADVVTDLETRLPARYDQPGALPAPGTAGLPPPETAAPDRAGVASASSPGASAPSPQAQRAQQEAQAARASTPFVGAAGAAAPTAPSASASAAPAAPSPTLASLSPLIAAPGALSAKEQFVEASGARGPKSAVLPRDPVSPYEIKAGTLISAALITGVNSDLPGPVIAQVTEPVFDHRSGRLLLIPQGARLIGRYDSQVAYGQDRVLLVWTQLVFPSGRTIDLGAMAGLDASGASGLTGKVDRHVSGLARAIGLSTLITIGGSAAQNSATRQDQNVILQDAAGGLASSASQTGQRLVERDLQRSPTLMIAPGQPVRVLIDRDLILPPETGWGR